MRNWRIAIPVPTKDNDHIPEFDVLSRKFWTEDGASEGARQVTRLIRANTREGGFFEAINGRRVPLAAVPIHVKTLRALAEKALERDVLRLAQHGLELNQLAAENIDPDKPIPYTVVEDAA